MTFETFDKSDAETLPDQQKDKDKDNDKELIHSHLLLHESVHQSWEKGDIVFNITQWEGKVRPSTMFVNCSRF